ncbi:MAG: hypothetical protein R2729_32950 [Bryobacteraceae bacterium]
MIRIERHKLAPGLTVDKVTLTRFALFTAVAAMAAGFLFGQTTVDLRSQARNVDFSQAASTRPHKVGTNLPAACGAGETFFKTDAPAGQNVFGCTATNVWSPLGSAAVSAGSGVTAVNGQVSTDDAVVPFYAVGNGAPSLPCQPGRDFYTDLTAGKLYSCVGADTWQQAGGGGGGGGGSVLALSPSSSLTEERVLTPRDGLSSTDSGANGTYTLDWNPLDRGVAWALEDFLTGNTSSGNVGAMGISRSTVGSAATFSYQPSPAGHPGVVRVTTAATASTGEWLSLGAVNNPFNSVSSTDWAATDWEVQFILAPGTNSTTLSNVRLRSGLSNGVSTVSGTLGIFLRYDTTLGDTTFRYQICGSITGCALAASGTDSQVADSGLTPVAGNWYRVRIRRVAAGVGGNPTIYFTINESSQRTFCASGCDATLAAMPSVGSLTAQVGYVSETAAAKSIDIDWIGYRIRGLSRN